MKNANRWLDGLSWIGILAFAAAIGLGVLVPVYVDEVATNLAQARFLAESGQMLSLFPQCSSGFVLKTPATWYPAALVFALLYGDLNPLGLRIAGVLLFLVWLAVFAGWVFGMTPDARQRLRTMAGMTAILGLGVLPLTLILARPEQWLFLILTCFLALAANADRLLSKGRFWKPAVLLAVFLLLTSLLNYAHPKALFFLPFVLVAAACIFGLQRRWLLALALAFSVFSAYQTFGVAKTVTRCEEAPVLAKLLGAQTTSLTMVSQDPMAFVAELSTNLVTAPGKIADQGVFQSRYQSGWLPPVPFATAGSGMKALNLGLRTVWYLSCLFAVLLPPLLLFLKPGKDTTVAKRLLMPGLWIGFVGHLAIYKEWNFYNGSLVIALAGMLLVHSLVRRRELPRLAWLGNGALGVLLLLVVVSTAVLGRQLGPPLLRAARSGDEVPVNQEAYSINAFAYTTTRERVRSLAESCGVAGDGATRLAVDNLTYFAFTGLRQPMHLGFMGPGGWGADIAGKTRKLLVDMQSDGMIARCELFGPEFRNQTLREGDLCCVDLKQRSYY
jgi:hypothetical protein